MNGSGEAERRVVSQHANVREVSGEHLGGIVVSGVINDHNLQLIRAGSLTSFQNGEQAGDDQVACVVSRDDDGELRHERQSWNQVVGRRRLSDHFMLSVSLRPVWRSELWYS